MPVTRGGASQPYLDPAPLGIDARALWDRGVDGTGIGVVDVEQGWVLDHPDFGGAHIDLISGLNVAFKGHGTATLGQIVAANSERGLVGVAPRARARVVSQWRADGSFDTAAAIADAARVMSRGDVLLVQAHTPYPTVAGAVPVEVDDAVFAAVTAAVAQGIVVIAAAGNGGVDLDAFVDLQHRPVFDRRFRDSGAIIVAAATAAVPHAPTRASNVGSRIDCYAWGEDIVTAGDGWLGGEAGASTTTFGGTSGASAIVAGATLLLQAWRTGNGRGPYTPAQTRALLASAALNTPSRDPGSDRIGVMPDLAAIVAHEHGSQV